MPKVSDVVDRIVQDRILKFILDYQRTHGGVSPNYRDIAAHIGRGTCSVAGRIKRLRDAGRLEHSFKDGRALRVLRRPTSCSQARLARKAARFQARGFVLVYHGNPATGAYTGFDVLAPGEGIFASISSE